MPLFQKTENPTEDDKKLAVVTFWLFIVAIFAWVIPLTVLFVLNLTATTVGSALGRALMPSLLTFAVTAILCIIVYFAYKRIVLKS